MANIIFFDVGGTLVDAPNLFEVYNEFISKYTKLDLTKELEESFMRYYQAEIFYSIEEIFQKVLGEISKRYGIEDCAKYARQIYYENFFDGIKIKEDAIEVLEIFQNREMIIASDADHEIMLNQLEKCGISRYFSSVYTSELLQTYKSSPNFGMKLRELVIGDMSDAIFVGDNRVDVNTAKVLGVRSVLISDESNDYGQDYLIKNLSELKKIIQ